MHLPNDYTKNLQISSPQTLATLRKKELCQTDLINKAKRSSIFYRSLLFQALHNCGHAQPEAVVLTNKAEKLSAYASHTAAYGVYVNFDEKSDWASQSYGTKRMVMYHEAVHVIKQHYNNVNNDYHAWQNEERMADQVAAIKANCTHCVRDFATHFLLEHTQKNYRDKLLQKYRNLTLQAVDAMPKKEKTILIKKTYELSKKRKQGHPLDLERALRLHAILVALGNVLCAHHQAPN